MNRVVAAPRQEGLTTQVMSALRGSALVKLVGQLLNWSITLFTMRILVPDDYGLVAMLTLIFLFLGMLGDMGFDSSIIQSPTLTTDEFRKTFGAALVVNVAICVALVAAAPAIARFYNEPRLVDMARVAALGFVLTAPCQIYNGLLQREMRFRASAMIEIGSGVVGNIATLAFALSGYGAWALILGTLLAGPLRAALLIGTASIRAWPSFRLAGTLRLWRFGGNVLATRIVWYWTSQADILIAGKFLGKEALGLYSVAVHLASLPMQRASGMINGVAFSAFAKIQNDPRAVARNTRLAVRLMAFVTFPVLWGIAAVAPELVHLAIGPTWQPSILPLTLVALTIPIRMIGSVITTTIMSMGRVDIALVTTLIGTCIAPPLFLVGARHGIVGLSVAWLVVTPILFSLNMFRALPILGLSFRVVASEMWRPLLVSAVMFGIVAATRDRLFGTPDFALFVILVATGALVYGAGTWIVNRAASVEALTLLFPTLLPAISARMRGRSSAA
jgi:O-antigen/teichoic acid export membrane protein